MPLPETIQWYRSVDGAAIFEVLDGAPIGVAYFGAGERRTVIQWVCGLVSIPLVDCHREILERPPAGPFQSSANYLVQRSAFIQERLVELYVLGIRAGLPETGEFYGVIQEHGSHRQLEAVRFEGQVLEMIPGPLIRMHRVGLVYSPVVLSWDHDPSVGRIPAGEAGSMSGLGLPIEVLRHYRRLDDDRVGPPELRSARAISPSALVPELKCDDEVVAEPSRVSRYERDPVI